MGVLNLTPDSFSDGGRFIDPQTALSHARAMVEAGATIVDVGGESTRPGATPVTADEELARVIPIIERLHQHIDAVISIDTMKPQVMQAAVAAGASLINDVRALEMPAALQTAARLPAAICLMHMRGLPATMQERPNYQDVVAEVRGYLLDRAQTCQSAGIASNRLVIDPGFGFGKTLAHNLALLAGLEQFSASLYPVLVGLSRKSMLGSLLGRDVTQRLPGSLALAALAVRAGASIVRCHDVAETTDAVRVAAALRRVEQETA